MLKSLLKAVGLLAILAWSGFAFAVGMGSINVTSSLGRPLKAEIPLVALENVDKSSITVKLASPSEFKNAGIDYPYALPKLKFEVETAANGAQYVRLTTTQPVNEPFVSLLLELSWSAGRLMREYTFLLDPEGFVAEQPKMAEVVPVEPVAPVAAASATPADAPSLPVEPAAAEPAAAIIPVPLLATAPAEQAAAPAEALAPAPAEPAPGVEAAALVAASAPAQAEPALAQADVAPDMEAKDLAAESTAAPAPVKDAAVAADTVAVKRGDTLGKIAAQVKPVEVSLERMVVALYHANNKEFDGKNMNRLRAGKILRMPESDDVSKVTQVAAVKEIRAHVADWQAYRQKLAAAPGKVTEPTAKQADAGKISTAVAEKAPAAKEPAKEVLKLSKGEAPGDKQVAAGVASKQDKRIAKADDALAKEKQLQEEQKRVADLEKMRKEGSKLVELKTQAAETKPAEAAPAASAPVAAASAVPAAKPKVVMPVTAAAPPSLLDELMAEPLYLAGAAVVLLGLGGLGFVAARRLRSQGGKKKK